MKPDREYWLDDPRNVNKIVYALYFVCGALVVVDQFYHKEVHFDFEHWFGFFGLFGLAGCLAGVLAARVVWLIVRRREDYYD